MGDVLAGGPGSDLVVGEDGLARPPWAATDPLLRDYYDTEWGMPVRDEQGLFERLSLEAFQSGLSWATILRKRPALRAAFAGFAPDAVAGFDDTDVDRLLQDGAIVRNRAKIEATIRNARATLALRGESPTGLRGESPTGLCDETGLGGLIWSHRPEVTPRPSRLSDIPTSSAESVALARELKRRGFAFVGPTTMFALMEAVGLVDTHLLGSHRRGCSGLWRPDGTRR